MAAASNTVTVSIQDVERVAELANLDLAPEEKPRMAHDLNAVLGYIAQLAELDTSNVEPMAQVSDLLEGSLDQSSRAHLRPDTVRPSLDRRAVMDAAPDTDGAFFKTPKVIER
jgi:aspartyl-tRNA(Asn)/glutamyl-tRNA(Gln) amidotransferase subunit C